MRIIGFVAPVPLRRVNRRRFIRYMAAPINADVFGNTFVSVVAGTTMAAAWRLSAAASGFCRDADDSGSGAAMSLETL